MKSNAACTFLEPVGMNCGFASMYVPPTLEGEVEDPGRGTTARSAATSGALSLAYWIDHGPSNIMASLPDSRGSVPVR
jgi:hypothetical protein